MKKTILIIIIILIIAAAGAAAWWTLTKKEDSTSVLNPPATKDDLIRLDAPRPNQTIQSPLVITGAARGSWFFEASFPVVLVNWDGLIIAQGIATAKDNWMTTEYVPFEAKLDFTIDKNTYSNRGALILKKDNPSGLPEHDNALEVPIVFDGIKEPPATFCAQDAKQCPDGSYVGRTGPNCEFEACPNSILPYNSGVNGTVMLGPTCPVMRDPPDPQCADKPYRTIVVIFRSSDLTRAFIITSSDADGKFSASLPPGDYTIGAGESNLPRCSNQQVTVEPNAYTATTISCDTGIR